MSVWLTLQGTSSIKEFYKKHHRWTEGLISAAKAVGWGANVLVYVLSVVFPLIFTDSMKY